MTEILLVALWQSTFLPSCFFGKISWAANIWAESEQLSRSLEKYTQWAKATPYTFLVAQPGTTVKILAPRAQKWRFTLPLFLAQIAQLAISQRQIQMKVPHFKPTNFFLSWSIPTPKGTYSSYSKSKNLPNSLAPDDFTKKNWTSFTLLLG